MLINDPGPGISAWPIDDNMLNLEAQIEGPQDSPYEEGTFRLNVQIPERYPLEPPRVRFLTPIYHPNIDSDGRICLDTLKMQPHGSWSPSINLNTLLLTIRVLMAQPNAEDGLVPDITEEYKRDVNLWKRKASLHTWNNAKTLDIQVQAGSGDGGENDALSGVKRAVGDTAVDSNIDTNTNEGDAEGKLDPKSSSSSSSSSFSSSDAKHTSDKKAKTEASDETPTSDAAVDTKEAECERDVEEDEEGDESGSEYESASEEEGAEGEEQVVSIYANV